MEQVGTRLMKWIVYFNKPVFSVLVVSVHVYLLIFRKLIYRLTQSCDILASFAMHKSPIRYFATTPLILLPVFILFSDFPTQLLLRFVTMDLIHALQILDLHFIEFHLLLFFYSIYFYSISLEIIQQLKGSLTRDLQTHTLHTGFKNLIQ